MRAGVEATEGTSRIERLERSGRVDDLLCFSQMLIRIPCSHDGDTAIAEDESCRPRSCRASRTSQKHDDRVKAEKTVLRFCSAILRHPRAVSYILKPAAYRA